jgi:hypothetical protein
MYSPVWQIEDNMSSRIQDNLEDKLEEVSSCVEAAKQAVLIQAPRLAAAQLKNAIEMAQGKLMEAHDLAWNHVKELEVRLKEE